MDKTLLNQGNINNSDSLGVEDSTVIDEDSTGNLDEAVLVGNKDEVVPKIPKLPSNYSSGDVFKKPELTYKQTRGLGIVARIAMKSVNIYRLMMFSVIMIALITMYADWASWDLMVRSLFWVSIGIQLIVGLLYLGLMVAIRGQDVVFQGKLKFMSVDVWRILSFWQHLRDNVVKDILIINSVLVLVSSLLMMKINNII